jgi:hypothetical protein
MGISVRGSHELFAPLALNRDPPDLYLLSHLDYGHEPPAPDTTSFLKLFSLLGTVAQDCNPSYSGGRDLEDKGLKPVSGKKFYETPSQPITWVLCTTVIPAM